MDYREMWEEQKKWILRASAEVPESRILSALYNMQSIELRELDKLKGISMAEGGSDETIHKN